MDLFSYFSPISHMFTHQMQDFNTFSDSNHLWKLLGDFELSKSLR